MYWQVYLHKTTVAYEKILVNILMRAKELASQGKELFASPALHYFLYNDVDRDFFISHKETLRNYETLDENDIWCSVKVWMNHEDKILSILSKDLINRNIFKVEIHENPLPEDQIIVIQNVLSEKAGVSFEDAKYLMSVSAIQKDMYNINDDHISILHKDGTIEDITEASEILNIALLSKQIRKYYLCYQRF